MKAKTKTRKKKANINKCTRKMCQGKPKIIHYLIADKYKASRKIKVQIKKTKSK